MTTPSVTWALLSGCPAVLLMVSADGSYVPFHEAVSAMVALAQENGIAPAFVHRLVKGRLRPLRSGVTQMTLFIKERQKVVADLTIYWSDGQDFTGHCYPVQWSDLQ